MSVRTFGLSAAVAAAALGFAFTGSPIPADAQSNPFAGLTGSWAGNGTISLTNGASERIRCRATYSVPVSNNLQLSIRCASDSYRFELQSSVVSQGGSAISGTWSETSRNIGGSISGTANAGQITARADTGGFAANLSVSTQGKRQTVSIRASGADISGVDITLSRS
ncbi:MAG: hypothetical protein QOD74_1348 [Variibacter sp.]|nr:hypothetical protein [Variibacter sp.]